MRSDSARTRVLCLPSAMCGPFCSVPPIGRMIVVLPAATSARSSGHVSSSRKTVSGVCASAAATSRARTVRRAAEVFTLGLPFLYNARGARTQRSTRGPGLAGRARPVDPYLDVLHQVLVHHDLHLVPLDVPVADRRQPAPGPPTVRDLTPAAVDQRLPPGRREVLAPLHVGAREPQDLFIGRLPRDDGRQPVARDNRAGVHLGGRRALGAQLQTT